MKTNNSWRRHFSRWRLLRVPRAVNSQGHHRRQRFGCGRNSLETGGPAPVKVPGLSGIVAITGNLALKIDRTVWLGVPPILVSGLEGAVAIAEGVV